MKTHNLSFALPLSWAVACCLMAPLQSIASTVVIDDHFDDGTVTGWMSQGNTRTFDAHNITETGSILSSEVLASQSNTNRAIVSEGSFDPGDGGFGMSFVVTSIDGTPGANGFFAGAVSGNDIFFRDTSLINFGLTFFGQNARTASGGGFGLIYADNNGSLPSTHILGSSDAAGDVEVASFLDGFSASIETTPSGWSYSIDGLNTAAGDPQVFADSGTWADVGTDYATLFGGDDSWHVTGSLQQVAANPHTVSYDRITVTTNAIPEPSTAWLTILAAGGLLLSRRRA